MEWLNFMLEKIWRSISQEFFATIESMVEDTIQGVTPGFIVSNGFGGGVIGLIHSAL